MYFQELPEPLFTYQMYSQFVDVISKSFLLNALVFQFFMQLKIVVMKYACFTELPNATEEQRLKLLMKLIDQLPPPNRKTLEVLLRHLCL